MNNILSPSILSADFCKLGEQIRAVDLAGAQYIHIDVMDGLFVPSISYGMPVIRSIRKATKRVFDVHLMIEKPERYVAEFAECGADIITFHLEAAEHPEELICQIHDLGLRAGIAIKPGTDAETVRPFLNSVDMVLVMTVEPGFGGQAYMDFCTPKIRAVRAMAKELGRELDIQVDGGIHKGNVDVVLEAGANVIVAGSAVFKENISENVACFLEKMK